MRARSSTGIDENLAGALTYLLGLISAIFFLLVERKSDYVRFHARQSAIVFGAVLVMHFAIESLPAFGLIHGLFVVVVLGLWLFLMAQALNGRRYKLF